VWVDGVVAAMIEAAKEERECALFFADIELARLDGGEKNDFIVTGFGMS
jgi:hypothetical protein